MKSDLLPEHSALQHERAPRPLPLFLELVRRVSEEDAVLSRNALAGLRAYEGARLGQRASPRAQIAKVGGASLLDYGGEGPPAVLIPSLINPPRILDLDPEVSFATAVAVMGRRTLLLDWGKADERSELSVAAHIERVLLPLLSGLGEPAALIGYCLGGTMAVAAANCVPCERLITLAAPWHFQRYPPSSRAALMDMWRHSKDSAESLGALPMEVLQAAFWSLDPNRTVRKFADFGRWDPNSSKARRFVMLEEWANEGEPLPFPAASELMEDLFGRDLPGAGEWQVGGEAMTDQISAPSLHFTAERDLIVPPVTAPAGPTVGVAAGHVGMIVGSARASLCARLHEFLAPCR